MAFTASPLAFFVLLNATPVSPDYSLTSAAFAEEFAKDREAHARKYQGKRIELAGKVVSVHRDRLEWASLLLECPAGDYLLVQCYTVDKEPWAKYAPGQKVKIQGTGTKYGTLRGCTVLESGPNPAVSRTAAQLAEEFTATFKPTAKKYHGRAILITGVILKKNQEEDGWNLELKGDGKTVVKCRFFHQETWMESLKVGEKIRFCAIFDHNFNEDGEKVYLDQCYLIGGR